MVLDKKERKMIYDVYRFMKREADRNTVENLKQCMNRTAEATQCSVSTVRRIVKEAKDSGGAPIFQTPKNKRVKQKPITDIDNFDQGVIKRMIYNFHVTENELPTVGKLRRKLQADLNFQGSAASLRRILKQMGFKFRKTDTNIKIMVEQSHIRYQRIKYLKEIQKFREEGRPIIYTGDSYVDSSNAIAHSGTVNSPNSIKKPLPKGSRLIIVHAGGEAGFVPNALLTFEAGTKGGDYINSENYEWWLRTKLIPNLPPHSVVVVNNESYHNKQVEAPPKANAKKTGMQTWLRQKGIEFEESMLKPELYNLIKKHKDQFKKFNIDAILNEAGHSVLRLPLFHPDLNPIEMAFSQIKAFVVGKNVNCSFTLMTDLVDEKVHLMGVIEWRKLCTMVKEVEIDYCESEFVVDKMTETFNFRNDDSDSNDDESSSEDSEDDEMATSSTNFEYAPSSGFQIVHMKTEADLDSE